MTEKIPPTSFNGKKEKVKDTPDSDSFKKLMKVEKPAEAEFEKGRKKKKFLEEEEEDLIPKSQLFLKTVLLPEMASILASDLKKISEKKGKKPFKKLEEKDLLKEKALLQKDMGKKPISLKKENLPKIKEKKLKKEIKKELLKGTIKSKEKTLLQKEEKEFKKLEEKDLLKKRPISKKGIKEKLKSQEKEFLQKEDKKTKKDLSFITFDIPKELETICSKKAEILPSSISKELSPVFEHVVGTIMIMKKTNVEETHIILNNPKFESSRFFNTKIIIEKYSTNPLSFNIRIIGASEEANTILLENLEGLQIAFNLKKENLGFSINQLSAEYETSKHLIKRKKSARHFERDSGDKKE